MRTEQIKDILRNKSHFKCISLSRAVISAVNIAEKYANLATILIINSNLLKK